MKSKKSAFANNSTGYGRHKHNGQSKGHGGHKTEGKSNKSKDGKEQLPREQKKEEQEKDLNSGFGDYLRTPEAFEMMKLFVFANTVMLIVTMAWPNIKEQFYMLNQWWESFREQQN